MYDILKMQKERLKKILERKGLIPDEKGSRTEKVSQNLKERRESKVQLSFNFDQK